MTDRLAALHGLGQSIWVDSISRPMLTSGELAGYVRDDSVTGLTSNPTIFEKAIAETSDYDQTIRDLVNRGTTSPLDIALSLFIADIQDAAAILRPVYDLSRGVDGYVSLEVPPNLASDTKRTVHMAKELWKRVNRPNLMIKIPATPEGIPAIEECLAFGINVNVTLIFSLSSYRDVIQAYTNALIDRHNHGKKLNVHSVASFFVSRVDSYVDPLLDAKIKAGGADSAALTALKGKAAIANAVLAYDMFRQHCLEDDEFQALVSLNAPYQRPLWASTSTKDPAYRDVRYVETLAGAHTVDTMPIATLRAFRDHGEVTASELANVKDAKATVDALASFGISMEDVTNHLLLNGVKLFSDSFDQLLVRILEKSDSTRSGVANRMSFALEPAIHDVVPTASDQGIAERIWKHDATLWKSDPAHVAVIDNRLGWLDVMDTMMKDLPRMKKLHASLVAEGITDVVLLGMGGSSLCPEVLRRSFGPQHGSPTLHVLDTTDPDTIQRLLSTIDIATTAFIVASKSGSTIETRSHFAFFHALYFDTRERNIGRHFIAITDPGSPLVQLAKDNHFRMIFENPPTIGGRYSALSYFGLVPAAVMGLDVEQLIAHGQEAARLCGSDVPPNLNPGLLLGKTFDRGRKSGRDKITIVCSQQIRSFSLWAEQLIAESTGKEGKGLIPIGDEPLGKPENYGDDRLFVALILAGDDALKSSMEAIAHAGNPVVTIEMNDVYDLGTEFFRWEFAVAVAGSFLGIDPFDEPNVKESKDNTNAVLASLTTKGLKEPDSVKAIRSDAFDISGPTVNGSDIEAALFSYLEMVQTFDYLAIQAYTDMSDSNYQDLEDFRVSLRDSHGVATTLGFGPRFLHSTGQLHKGGPNIGVFIQIVAAAEHDAIIPGVDYSFDTLKLAQALGDLTSLINHDRRVLRITCNDSLSEVVRSLTQQVRLANNVRS